MAASSPALSNNSTDTSSVAASIGGNSFNNISGGSNSSKNQRGLNKPKCIKCGNVARSRCPYQSCKSCCAKAQNPCHIHVLKGASSLPDKVPSSGSPSFDQLSTEVSSSGNSFRVASLRQLSNNFAQFNNLQSPLRSRKPLTKKEALVINEWRFMKLKEYRDRNIEVENDAFDRYMQNVSLLEEVFAASSTLEEGKKHASPLSNSCPDGEKKDEPISNPNTNSEQKHESISNPDPNSEQNHEIIPNPSPSSEQNDESIPNPDPNSQQTHETKPDLDPDPSSERTHETIPNPDPKQTHETTSNPDPNSEQTHETTSNPGPNSEQTQGTIPNPDPKQTHATIPNFEPSTEQTHETIPNPGPNSEQTQETTPKPDPNSEQKEESILQSDPNSEENHERISFLKLKLRSDPERIEISRKRVLYIVDQGLKKLKKLDAPNVVYDLSDEAELVKRPRKAEYSRAERIMALRDLTDKLSKARNEEDLQSCREIIARLFDTSEKANEGLSEYIETLEQQDATKEESYKRPSPPKWFNTVTIDQEAVNRIDAHFSSLEEIEDL